MIATSVVQLATPGGKSVSFVTRDGTNDANVCTALTAGDEYHMRGREFSGTVIDVGAHIGAWAVPTALDHPGLRVIAVEAVPDNCDLLAENIRRNGVEVTVVRAAAARPGEATAACHWGYTRHDSASEGYVSDHRFVGNTWASLAEPEFGGEVTAVSLDDLLEKYADEIALLKIDCEGCEWAFLDSPAISRVAEIIGEYHGGYTGHPNHVPQPATRIRQMLEATHEVTTGEDTIVGPFSAVRRG